MPFPINSVFANRNNPDIHRKASNFQFVINDIFHNMSFFEIPETETRIAKPHISRIVLQWEVEILFSFHIITISLRKQIV